MPAVEKQDYANNFDGLRLLLAMLVIWGHQDHGQQWAADAAVLSFFVLSGLLVSKSWFADPNLWRFSLRRFLRIWPGLAVVVIVCAGASYLFATGPWAAIQRLASVFYLRNLWLHIFDWSFFPWQPTGMNGSIWTLPFEVDLYGALAILGLLGRRFFFAVIPLVWVAAFFVRPVAGTPTQLGGAWSLYFAGFFFAGASLARWPQLLRPAVALAVAAVGVALLAFGQVDAGRLVLVPVATVSIGIRSWHVLRSLSRFGDLSYGAYIWAWPVQQVTRLWLPGELPVWVQLLVVIPQVLLVAFLSWHLVEKRALRKKPRAGSDSTPGAAWWRLEVGSIRETREKWSRIFRRAR